MYARKETPISGAELLDKNLLVAKMDGVKKNANWGEIAAKERINRRGSGKFDFDSESCAQHLKVLKRQTLGDKLRKSRMFLIGDGLAEYLNGSVCIHRDSEYIGQQ